MPEWLGYLALGAAFLFAQERYYEIHRRHHRAFRPMAQRWFRPRLDEARAMISATFRTDSIPDVERARRQYLAVVVIAFIAAVAVAFSR
jgi:ferric-dicitrate binding protein FerR (iron transport regulator)